MTESPEQRKLPLPDPRVIYRALPDGAVLLSTTDEVYFGLNRVGAQVWELLPSRRTMDALCEELEQRYADVDPRTIRADVAELLATLQSFGLVRPPSRTVEADARPSKADRADLGGMG